MIPALAMIELYFHKYHLIKLIIHLFTVIYREIGTNPFS